ncbi:MAG: hypothetical protein P1U86_12700 [Verrucomicrobiales bacterium]|nr:hypothetical protein [Verrucomicrobiales bacterium]
MEEAEEASPAKRTPKSTTYVIGSACLAALILGMTLFLLVRGFQWRSALADLRSEPGIEILSVERLGFFKKRLRGLKDPLAPTAESILTKHNIGPGSAEVLLTEYHSLNTPYAVARTEKEQARFNELKTSLTTALGEFAKSMTEKRETDLEKITQMLFEARFPQAMESVDIHWKKGEWLLKGELYAPARATLIEEAPTYLVEGELNIEDLVDLTESRGSSLREQIQSTNLLAVDIDGKTAHTGRIARLLKDYDEVCEHSNLPFPRYRLEAQAVDRSAIRLKLDAIRKQLIDNASLDEKRFLLDSIKTISDSGEVKAHLFIVPTPQ